MSMVRGFWPSCDICKGSDEGYMDYWSSSVREAMKRDGWKRRGSLDVCPECADGTAADDEADAL